MSFLIFVLGLAFVTATNPWERDYKIPKNVVPISYNLILHPNLDAGNYQGEVTALVNITSPRDWLPIHIKSLNISKTVLTNSEGKSVKVLKTFKYKPHQFWIIKSQRIQPGLLKINLKFKGSLIESITGFYKSVYRENGAVRCSEEWTSIYDNEEEQFLKHNEAENARQVIVFSKEDIID